jgi:hypothetical protein
MICYEKIQYNIIEILIYKYAFGSKGPCRDCPLQRPPGFQHETPQKCFSEFAKVVFFG